jgi:hypothetical protein
LDDVFGVSRIPTEETCQAEERNPVPLESETKHIVPLRFYGAPRFCLRHTYNAYRPREVASVPRISNPVHRTAILGSASEHAPSAPYGYRFYAVREHAAIARDHVRPDPAFRDWLFSTREPDDLRSAIGG